MVGQSAARQLGVPHGLLVGGDATIVLVDAVGPMAAVREVGRVLAGWKNGHMSFNNGRARIRRRSLV
jgi:cytosine deaminase